MKKYLLIILLSLMLPVLARAASITFDPSSISVAPESSILISLDVTSDELVNAFEGTIPVPSHLEISEIIDGGSIITVWIERPYIESGVLKFAGITPGGFVGKGTLLLLRVTAKSKGDGALIFRGLVLRHDGKGTREPLSVGLSQIKVDDSYGKRVDTLEDDEAPESFAPVVAQDPNIFNGAWFVAWEAQDKGSGIKNYEIVETKEIEKIDGVLVPKNPAWVEAKSPYELKDQKRKSYIFIRATDNRGNERISVIEPDRRPVPLPSILGGIVFLIVIAAILRYYMRKARGLLTS